MAPTLGPAASLGYTPFEYWKGPKPVLPGSSSRRRSQPGSVDREPLLLAASKPARTRPRAASTGPGRPLPSSIFVAQPGTYAVRSDNGGGGEGGGAPFAEILVVPPRVLVHPLFRDEIKTPDWPRGVSPYYPGSLRDLEHNDAMDKYAFSSDDDEDLGRETAAAAAAAWWDPRGWRKRAWAGLGLAVVLVALAVAVAVVITQNKSRYSDDANPSYNTCGAGPCPSSSSSLPAARAFG